MLHFMYMLLNNITHLRVMCARALKYLFQCLSRFGEQLWQLFIYTSTFSRMFSFTCSSLYSLKMYIVMLFRCINWTARCRLFSIASNFSFSFQLEQMNFQQVYNMSGFWLQFRVFCLPLQLPVVGIAKRSSVRTDAFLKLNLTVVHFFLVVHKIKTATHFLFRNLHRICCEIALHFVHLLF